MCIFMLLWDVICFKCECCVKIVLANFGGVKVANFGGSRRENWDICASHCISCITFWQLTNIWQVDKQVGVDKPWMESSKYFWGRHQILFVTSGSREKETHHVGLARYWQGLSRIGEPLLAISRFCWQRKMCTWLQFEILSDKAFVKGANAYFSPVFCISILYVHSLDLYICIFVYLYICIFVYLAVGQVAPLSVWALSTSTHSINHSYLLYLTTDQAKCCHFIWTFVLLSNILNWANLYNLKCPLGGIFKLKLNTHKPMNQNTLKKSMMWYLPFLGRQSQNCEFYILWQWKCIRWPHPSKEFPFPWIQDDTTCLEDGMCAKDEEREPLQPDGNNKDVKVMKVKVKEWKDILFSGWKWKWKSKDMYLVLRW